MVSRCESAIDEVNSIALQIERRQKKNDACYVAQETLERLRREKQTIGRPLSRRETRKSSSLSGNTLSHSKKRDFQRRSSEQTAKWSDRGTLSSANFSKRSEKKPPQTPKTSPKRPTTMPDYGKTYTNRCVKEILNKLEHGPYASEWYNFSNPNMPTPKWINFSLDESGGVLDAFLCKKDDENHTCYMMDVRIGEKVGRLFKYPSPIRVGRNGYVTNHNDCKSHYNFVLEDIALTNSRRSGKKSRPFPLCWSEQFEWEDVKVVTVTDKDENQSVEETKQIVDKDVGESNAVRKEPKGVKNDQKATHSYAIEPVDLRVIQNLPHMKTRQKRIRDFSIADRSKNLQRAKTTDSPKGIDLTGEPASWYSKTWQKNYKQEASKRKDLLSVNTKPVPYDTDIEVENLCENEPNRDGKRQFPDFSGNTDDVERGKTLVFRKVAGNEKSMGRESADITKRDFTSNNVEENVKGPVCNHEDEIISYGNTNQFTAGHKPSGILRNSFTSDKEAKKREVRFSRIGSSKQTNEKKHELSCTNNGSDVMSEVTDHPEVARRELFFLNYNVAEEVIEGATDFTDHGRAGRSTNEINSSGQMPADEHGNPINNETSLLEKDIDTLRLKVS